MSPQRLIRGFKTTFKDGNFFNGRFEKPIEWIEYQAKAPFINLSGVIGYEVLFEESKLEQTGTVNNPAILKDPPTEDTRVLPLGQWKTTTGVKIIIESKEIDMLDCLTGKLENNIMLENGRILPPGHILHFHCRTGDLKNASPIVFNAIGNLKNHRRGGEDTW